MQPGQSTPDAVSPAALAAAVKLLRQQNSTRTKEALAAKKAAGEVTGSGWKRGNLAGHEIKTMRSLDGKKMLKYWYPNRKELPLLRYIVWLRDRCVQRRLRRTLTRTPKWRKDLQIVTQAEAGRLGKDPAWTNWVQIGPHFPDRLPRFDTRFALRP